MTQFPHRPSPHDAERLYRCRVHLVADPEDPMWRGAKVTHMRGFQARAPRPQGVALGFQLLRPGTATYWPSEIRDWKQSPHLWTAAELLIYDVEATASGLPQVGIRAVQLGTQFLVLHPDWVKALLRPPSDPKRKTHQDLFRELWSRKDAAHVR